MSYVTDPVERYVRAVEARILADEDERVRLAADLRDHLEAARAEGATSWSDLVERMGPPEEVAAAFRAEHPFRYAGFWRRFVAFLGDLGLLGLVSAPPLILFLLLVRSVEGASPPERLLLGSAAAAIGFAVFVAWILYFPLFEAHSGKTPAKHWIGIRVLRESGDPIHAGQAFLRRLSLFLKLLVPDALFIPFTERRQRALDLLAHTIVVREPGRDAPPIAWIVCPLLPLVAIGCICGVLMIAAV